MELGSQPTGCFSRKGFIAIVLPLLFTIVELVADKNRPVMFKQVGQKGVNRKMEIDIFIQKLFFEGEGVSLAGIQSGKYIYSIYEENLTKLFYYIVANFSQRLKELSTLPK